MCHLLKYEVKSSGHINSSKSVAPKLEKKVYDKQWSVL